MNGFRWNSIRNVHILYEEKWFNVHVFTKNKKEIDEKNPILSISPLSDTDKQNILETEITWIEDFNQSKEWID